MTTPPVAPPPSPLSPARVRPAAHVERRSRSRTRQLRVLAVALALALVAGIGWAVMQFGDREPTGAARFTTVTAARGSVTQRVVTSGTVTKVNEMSVRFPADGTVTELRAAVGDTVAFGDVLAVMDDSSLRSRVLTAQAAVDAAALSLHVVKQSGGSGESPEPDIDLPVSGGSGAGAGGLPVPPPPPLPEAPEPAVDLSPLDAARAEADAAAAVVAARTAEADAALAAMHQACRPVLASPSPEPTDSPTPSPEPSPEPSASGTPDPTALADVTPAPAVDGQACGAAAERVAGAQQAVSEAQAAASAANALIPDAAGGVSGALAGAVGQLRAWAEAVTCALDTWQQQVARARSAPSSPDVVQEPSVSLGSGSTGSSESNANRSAIVQAEVALSRARRDLAQAQEQLVAATMRAPMAGTLSALPWSAGSTASTSQRAVVSAPGAVTVTVAIPAASFLAVQPGQQATVRAPGGVETMATVASKALVPNATGGFAVTILTSGANADQLAGGSTATVEIGVSSVSDVTVLPLSAVQRSGDEGTVRRLEGDEYTEVPVRLGSVGDTHVEVLEGIEVGDRLVVADATVPLPGLDFGGPE